MGGGALSYVDMQGLLRLLTLALNFQRGPTVVRSQNVHLVKPSRSEGAPEGAPAQGGPHAAPPMGGNSDSAVQDAKVRSSTLCTAFA